MTPRCYWIGDTLWEEVPGQDLLRQLWSPRKEWECTWTVTREGLDLIGGTLVAVA